MNIVTNMERFFFDKASRFQKVTTRPIADTMQQKVIGLAVFMLKSLVSLMLGLILGALLFSSFVVTFAIVSLVAIALRL